MIKRWRKLNSINRIMIAVTLTVLISFGFCSAGFIVKIQRELEKKTLYELELTTEQLKSNLDVDIQNILSISGWILSNNQLCQELTKTFEKPYDYWEFYDYFGELSSGIMEMDSYIHLITVFTSNETLKPDKKHVRDINEIKDTEIYREVLERKGSAVFGMMRDAMPEDYFKYNLASDGDNLCMLRLMDYQGTQQILMLEIKRMLFVNEFCRQSDKGMFVTDASGGVLMYYNRGKNQWNGNLTKDAMEELKKDNIYIEQVLDNQWTVTLFQGKNELFASVNHSVRELIVSGCLIVLLMLGIILLVLQKTSTRLKELNSVIQKAYLVSKNRAEECAVLQSQTPSEEEQDEVGMVLHSFQNLMNRVDYLMKEIYEKEIENKTMELNLLHSQIKPHFLYNTLSSIASLARKYQDKQLVDMITSLSELYRTSLSRGKDIITIEKEIEMTKNYLVIMENRFEDMIHVEFKTDPEALQGLIPKILLQPFVENSINHAIRPDQILNIIIDIRKVHENVLFQIYDDGLGMDDDQVAELLDTETIHSEKENGYGIPNVAQRIKIFMGEQYGVEILSKKDVGTNVKITVPYWTEECDFKRS